MRKTIQKILETLRAPNYKLFIDHLIEQGLIRNKDLFEHDYGKRYCMFNTLVRPTKKRLIKVYEPLEDIMTEDWVYDMEQKILDTIKEDALVVRICWITCIQTITNEEHVLLIYYHIEE